MAKRRPSRRLTDAQRRKALALHQEGKTYRDIVTMMEVRHPQMAKNLLRLLLTAPRSRLEL
jgi:hypothetical protein